MRLLVTGTGGQLVQSLLERAHGRAQVEMLTVGRPEVDLEIPGSVGEAIGRAAPDLVINAAAYTDVDRAEDEPDRAHRINAEAAGEAAAAACRLGAPFIQISTDYVFDGEARDPYTEEALPNPIGAYGRSKFAGEEAVRAATPDHLILRTSWVYGPFGRNFVRTMFEAAERNDQLRVVADQRGSPTAALDLALGVLAVAERWRDGSRMGRGETYHLAGRGAATWFQLAEQVMSQRRSLGLAAAELTPITTEEWPTRARRSRNSMLDSGKFERDFGFQMPAWQASVASTVERLAKQDE